MSGVIKAAAVATTTWLAALSLLVGVEAGAATIVGGGIDDGGACPSSAGTCSDNYDFNVVGTSSVTGTITEGGGSVTINVTLPSMTMPGSAGPVTEVVFTNVTYSYSGSTIGGFGSVSGTYSQTGGTGDTAFNLANSVLFSSYTEGCDLLCGFTVGRSGFTLSVNSTNHDFVHTFNVVIPEPSTALLLGGGLAALAARRRRSR